MKKLMCFGLAMMLCVGIASGCQNKTSGGGSSIQEGADFTYPIKTDEKLQYWYVDYTAGKTKREETPLDQEMVKRTGVTVEYIPVTSSVATEQFNLLLASGNLPDIVAYEWLNFPAGAQSAVDGKQILNLNQLIEDHMPNLKAYMAADETRSKQAKNDAGNYCFVPSYRGDEELLTYTGPIIRKDWLDELKLDIPETLDEWYTVLKAFKEQKGAESPFVCPPEYVSMFISGAYPVSMGGYSEDFYLEDGKVVYGPIQPSCKEALKVLSKWYKEGLIDANIASVDSNAINAKMTNGQSGASIGLAGGGMGKWLLNMKNTDSGYDLVGTTYPVVNKGDKAYMGQRDNTISGHGQAISATSKHPEVAARYLDYFFSEEGINLVDFGVEGVAHDVINGKPIFKESILQSGELDRYANIGGGISVQKWDSYSQNLLFENQKTAIQNWGKTDADKHLMPPITYSKEESSKATKLMSDIKTFKDEKFFKFLLGVEDVETGFDAYVAKINEMGIDTVIACKQAALDRYNNR